MEEGRLWQGYIVFKAYRFEQAEVMGQLSIKENHPSQN